MTGVRGWDIKRVLSENIPSKEVGGTFRERRLLRGLELPGMTMNYQTPEDLKIYPVTDWDSRQLTEKGRGER